MPMVVCWRMDEWVVSMKLLLVLSIAYKLGKRRRGGGRRGRRGRWAITILRLLKSLVATLSEYCGVAFSLGEGRRQCTGRTEGGASDEVFLGGVWERSLGSW